MLTVFIYRTGGAATPKSIDGFYTKHKINIINMFAMSGKYIYLLPDMKIIIIYLLEAFNLLATDGTQARVNSNTYFFLQDALKHAYMEPFDKNRFQLIIMKGSPFLATDVQNRQNGEYATKNLFVKSKLIENGYNYAGRADDILVM